ncbi:MAG TPA: TlpA family protein disulfide reductase [Nitrosomonas sp.]|nr:TlpA family protein disulfide reductase [Nitrosomonas sp.]
MPKLSHIILFFAAAIVALSAGVWLRAHFMDSPQPPLPEETSKQGAEAILSASLPDIEGVTQSVSQWQGNVIVVNFWATWCTPCREEIPEFIELQNQYSGQGLVFIGIAIDREDKVVPYSQEFGINYPVLIGGLGAMSLAEAAGNEMSVLPYTVVFDRQGNITDTFLGRVHKKTMEKSIKPLLQNDSVITEQSSL